MSTEVGQNEVRPRTAESSRVALLGNPNTGKTTLFNRLCGARQKTSNFPGTTQEARVGLVRADDHGAMELIDLPGVYSIELEMTEASLCRGMISGEIALRGERLAPPDVICVVIDATDLGRGLVLVGEALRRRLPTVVAINMVDLARRRGVHADEGKLADILGCAVVVCSARTGEGLERLLSEMAQAAIPNRTPPGDAQGLERWADEVFAEVALGDERDEASTITDRLDKAFTHPVAGVATFAIVMALMFYVIFKLATYPMDLVDGLFASLADGVRRVLPDGILADLLAGGVIGGVGATVIFVPQICLLFFMISLLEDTGYLARAAFVMDRVLRPFGLSGHSFVPLLSSHACALPGIMSARAVPDRKDRLATILIAPFMTCSARIPVYVLLTTILFRDRPAMGAIAFVGCYALGILAALGSAMLVRRTILRGKSRPMALELPSYKVPSLSTALLTTLDRGLVFLKKAGSTILAISIVLWWLSTYPIVEPPSVATDLRDRSDAMVATAGDDSPDALHESEMLLAEAARLEAIHATRMSFAGRLGRGIEPLFRPLGFDWQLSVGVLSSFAAREVFVSTMAVMLTGEEDAETDGILDRLARATREDGVTPVFTVAVSWALLVYYVLAMQCLPTLAVTAKESGSVKWAGLQLAWMCAVAYLAAMIVYQSLLMVGVR
ncbi:MAG: ferrous iron transporter B [Phycisphaeraceae bacterium]|nr:ferrous iron transporter B [Phycisphaeraceae bacterium]